MEKRVCVSHVIVVINIHGAVRMCNLVGAVIIIIIRFSVCVHAREVNRYRNRDHCGIVLINYCTRNYKVVPLITLRFR